MEIIAAIIGLVLLGVFLWMAVTLADIQRSVAALEARFRKAEPRNEHSVDEMLDDELPLALAVVEAEKLSPAMREEYWRARSARQRQQRSTDS